MRQLEEENLRLKKLVADLSLSKAMLQVVLAKRTDADASARMGPGPAGTLRRHEILVWFVLRVNLSSFRYRTIAADDSALHLRIRVITKTRVHYGYLTGLVLLWRKGWRDNHKRIYKLYSEQGLSLCLKRLHRNKSAQRREPLPQGLYLNHVWG
ncbi:TPA: hypothetical protein MB295_001170 [Klebsiella pneumoniae]|nr:hypothetical protein [Klebsiella pneumoniae]